MIITPFLARPTESPRQNQRLIQSSDFLFLQAWLSSLHRRGLPTKRQRDYPNLHFRQWRLSMTPQMDWKQKIWSLTGP